MRKGCGKQKRVYMDLVKMERKKLLFENILVYGLGGMMGNFIPYAMLPIITRLMRDTQYYGYSDIVITIVSFVSAVMTMGLYDASFRVVFDYDELKGKKGVYNSALILVMLLALTGGAGAILCSDIMAKLLFGSAEFKMLWMIAIATSILRAIANVHNMPLRSQNRKKIYLILNIVQPSLPYLISIPMMIKGEYLYALPIAALGCEFVMCLVYFTINFQWFDLRLGNKENCRSLLKIGVPLMPCFIMYWVFNSCDKLMILKYLGANANGVYAVGSKIGHMSQLIYQAFTSGWQYFAYATMKDVDQIEMLSKIMEILNVISCGAAIIMAMIAESVFQMFFTGDYRNGAVVAPYLFFAPLILMLYQTISSQFMILNKPWVCSCILCVGAVINVFCNIWWIPMFGIEGAALATLIGYIMTLMIAVVVLVKIKKLKLSRKIFYTWGILVLFSIFWRTVCYDYLIAKCILGGMALSIYIILYRHSMKRLFREICIRFSSK